METRSRRRKSQQTNSSENEQILLHLDAPLASQHTKNDQASQVYDFS